MTNLDLLNIIYMITEENDITTIDELVGFLTENNGLKIVVEKVS